MASLTTVWRPEEHGRIWNYMMKVRECVELRMLLRRPTSNHYESKCMKLVSNQKRCQIVLVCWQSLPDTLKQNSIAEALIQSEEIFISVKNTDQWRSIYIFACCQSLPDVILAPKIKSKVLKTWSSIRQWLPALSTKQPTDWDLSMCIARLITSGNDCENVQKC